jgi:hypothetical protein
MIDPVWFTVSALGLSVLATIVLCEFLHASSK